MDPIILLVSLVAGYLIGAISFTRIVSHRVAPATDVTNSRPRHPGPERGAAGVRQRHRRRDQAGAQIRHVRGHPGHPQGFHPTIIFKLVFPANRAS